MRRFWQKIRALKNDVYILYLAVKHPQTPSVVKLLVGLVLIYTLSPIDLLPDYIPGFGYIDEIILVPVFLSIAYRLVPQPILAECRLLAQKGLRSKKRQLGTVALLLLALCLLLIFYAIYWYFRQNQ